MAPNRSRSRIQPRQEMASPCFLLLFFLITTTHHPISAAAQPLSASQSKTLLRLQRILEYPSSLSPLTPHTNFCSLPTSPSLSLSCSTGRLVALSISGDLRRPLSPTFSSDSLFTTLSRFPALTHLSLVSLGLWGPLPPKLHRLSALQYLNLSSNHLQGPIPLEISHLASLKTLILADNAFNGTVPDLTPMTHLAELDLGGNLLGPDFPPLAGETLTTLVLKANTFRARIPTSLESFNQLKKLDVSGNRLFGPVPPFLFSLPSIRFLDLSGNRLAGALPADLSCSDGLAFVDLSGNLLVGSLPWCIRDNSSGRVVLSSGNCLSSGSPEFQHPSSSCTEGAIAAILPPAAAANEAGSKSRLGPMLGIAAAVVVGSALVMGLLLLFVVFNKGRAEVAEGKKKPVAAKAPIHVSSKTPGETRHMTAAVRIGVLGLTPYRVFTLEELEEATNGFDASNFIGEGPGPGGLFYKGCLWDGSTVIVRCMKLKQKHSPQSLIPSMDIISKLRHRHLVSILGYCIDIRQDNTNTTSSVFLVFEFVSNGTLRSHLTEWRKREMLKWPQRVAAVIGVARGVQFLHTVTAPGIVGNDLNIENILLDETLTAKISNYNLPVLPKDKNNKKGSECPFFTPVEDNDLGSIHNWEHGEKGDVYQMGLILVEVITGKPADTQSELYKLKAQLQKSLNDEPAMLQAITDPTIRGTFAYDSLRIAVEITLKCLAEDPSERPSIDDILWNLHYSVQVQDGWASSENLSTQS